MDFDIRRREDGSPPGAQDRSAGHGPRTGVVAVSGHSRGRTSRGTTPGPSRIDTHFPRARQVAAFTLARLGDVASVQADLRDPDEASELSEFLTKVPRPSN
jgi:hypothetical protein